ncbi:unnamed protein product [Allacma fusca]|uniref:Vitelline membrane outer layer protein 1 n=1 Tax=Allacma fusca TaxID=39272 RepID=A0A8J2P2F4_9HEXA|nr:unnamed protein product [Allacma fusca]
MAFCCSGVISEIIIIESTQITNWGTWFDYKECPRGSFVHAFQLKVQKTMNDISDDTGLNGIYLLCSTPAVRRFIYEFFGPYAPTPPADSISSKVGNFGEIRNLFECAGGSYVVGLQLRSQESQGIFWDDSAANNIRLRCSDGQILEGDGEEVGEWSAAVKCPKNLMVCGIQTQVEFAAVDETALNNVRMGCCQRV